MKVLIWMLRFLFVLCVIQSCSAGPIRTMDPVQIRADKEEWIPLHYIGIAFYKPNFILPYYYTGSPYNSVYAHHTPSNEQIKNSEVKYQISLKVPILKNILGYPLSFYLAYTFQTYWQVYNKKPFIRETDYEPALFFRNNINYFFYPCWSLDFLNIGYVHQSNGWGNRLERSWDRIYLEAITAIDNWMISIKPWYVIMTYGNPDIADYLGYASFLLAYQFHEQVFSLQLTNLGTTPKRTTVNITWSFPVTDYLKGYVEVFSGYGQSLIEYNHHTNSAGIGIALNDWI